MSVFFWLIVLLAVHQADIKKVGFHEDYISLKAIQPIKGVFTLLIFMSHFVGYLKLESVWDVSYFPIRAWLGQLVVVPFLFYSGYGIAESIRQKGLPYVKSMPKNRILKVLFQFDVAVAMYLLLRYTEGITYSPYELLLACAGRKSVGNSNWYILAIVCLYLATWLSCLIFRKNSFLQILSTAMLTGVYIIWTKATNWPEYTCNTVMAYVAGMVFSCCREKFEKMLNASNGYVYILGITLILMQYFHGYWDKILIYQMVSILFALAMVLLTMKIRISSRFLSYCGEHLFSLYILQRLPMHALNDTAIEQWPYLYFIVCLVITFVLSAMFDKLVPMLWSALFERKRVDKAAAA